MRVTGERTGLDREAKQRTVTKVYQRPAGEQAANSLVGYPLGFLRPRLLISSGEANDLAIINRRNPHCVGRSFDTRGRGHRTHYRERLRRQSAVEMGHHAIDNCSERRGRAKSREFLQLF